MRKFAVSASAGLLMLSGAALAQGGATTSALDAARADADLMEVFGQRTMAADGDENGGFYVCPSDVAAGKVLTELRRVPEGARDELADTHLVKNGCKQGSASISNIKATQVVGKNYTHWYSGTADLRTRKVYVVMWAVN